MRHSWKHSLAGLVLVSALGSDTGPVAAEEPPKKPTGQSQLLEPLVLPLTADDIPNVYITATLIKPHELSEIPLTVAHGYQSVKVEGKERKMSVNIVAAKSVPCCPSIL